MGYVELGGADPPRCWPVQVTRPEGAPLRDRPVSTTLAPRKVLDVGTMVGVDCQIQGTDETGQPATWLRVEGDTAQMKPLGGTFIREQFVALIHLPQLPAAGRARCPRPLPRRRRPSRRPPRQRRHPPRRPRPPRRHQPPRRRRQPRRSRQARHRRRPPRRGERGTGAFKVHCARGKQVADREHRRAMRNRASYRCKSAITKYVSEATEGPSEATSGPLNTETAIRRL